ncbi:P-loop containing nucleoside triphosphate hydrolase protein, partial [Cercophora newfieldiana]
DNILFGLPLNQERYQTALHSCALKKDLVALENGDMTVAGAKGISLSGGQQCRVALARALYSRAGILLLDDVLSAV